jgi:hypothetical protein
MVLSHGLSRLWLRFFLEGLNLPSQFGYPLYCPLKFSVFLPELTPEPLNVTALAMLGLIAELVLQGFQLKLQYLVCLDAVHLG